MKSTIGILGVALAAALACSAASIAGNSGFNAAGSPRADVSEPPAGSFKTAAKVAYYYTRGLGTDRPRMSRHSRIQAPASIASRRQSRSIPPRTIRWCR